MTPTLILGPSDSPSIEFMPQDIEPLVILMIEFCRPLSASELDSVWAFTGLDTLHLREGSIGFFLKLEDMCGRVLAGELTRYDVEKIKNSEFAGYLDRFCTDGVLTPGVRVAARRCLDFLAANPNFWPPKFAEA